MSRQEENGKTTQCEHYRDGHSNLVALNVTEEKVVDPGKVEMVMNVSNRMSCYMLLVL